jgi:hypothetical protein
MDDKRTQDIIKSKHCPAELTKIVAEGTHLEPADQRQLLRTLQKYEELFNGPLGTWKTDPIQLELKDSKCPALSHKTIPCAIFPREEAKSGNKMVM